MKRIDIDPACQGQQKKDWQSVTWEAGTCERRCQGGRLREPGPASRAARFRQKRQAGRLAAHCPCRKQSNQLWLRQSRSHLRGQRPPGRGGGACGHDAHLAACHTGIPSGIRVRKAAGSERVAALPLRPFYEDTPAEPGSRVDPPLYTCFARPVIGYTATASSCGSQYSAGGRRLLLVLLGRDGQVDRLTMSSRRYLLSVEVALVALALAFTDPPRPPPRGLAGGICSSRRQARKAAKGVVGLATVQAPGCGTS
jgi:hypothetical protein